MPLSLLLLWERSADSSILEGNMRTLCAVPNVLAMTILSWFGSRVPIPSLVWIASRQLVSLRESHNGSRAICGGPPDHLRIAAQSTWPHPLDITLPQPCIPRLPGLTLYECRPSGGLGRGIKQLNHARSTNIRIAHI